MSTAAETFRRLHAGPDLLLLSNAWDAASAKVLEAAGAKAVATSSAAVAWSHGYADGHKLPTDLMLATTHNIARVLSVPLTADIEGGYSDDPAQVGETVAAVIEAGAVGINIEDGTSPPDLLAAKIEAARKAADRLGVALFINARTDVYLRKLAEGEAALAETVRRGVLYASAGADGLFAPAAMKPQDIEAIVRGVGLPLNVLALRGMPSAAELQQLGARRLSSGTAMFHPAYTALRAAAEAWLADGDCDALATAGGAPPNYNTLFAGG